MAPVRPEASSVPHKSFDIARWPGRSLDHLDSDPGGVGSTHGLARNTVKPRSKLTDELETSDSEPALLVVAFANGRSSRPRWISYRQAGSAQVPQRAGSC